MNFKAVRSSFAPFIFVFIAHWAIPGFASTFGVYGSGPQIEQSDEWDKFFDSWAKPISLGSEQFKIKFSGESRYRLELKDSFNFSRKYEDDVLNLFRNRLGVQIEAGSNVTFFAQGQDSESFARQRANRSSSFVNRLDLHQLYVEAKSPIKEIPLTIKAGRQKLMYGDQRFVGPLDWSNVSRVFDAVKTVWKWSEKVQTDFWYSQVVPINRSQADSADHSNHFWGAYIATKPIVDHIFDIFLLVRHDEDNELPGERSYQKGQLKEYTAGNLLKGKKYGFDYGIEWAYQFGSKSHNLIDAFAWHSELGYTFSKIMWKPWIGAEFNHGSGDESPSDGRAGNFDNLFPTNHIYYGYMDLASLRNINHVKVGVSAKPTEKIKLAADYHFFFLDTNQSPWFNSGQTAIRAANTNASTDIGREIDLTFWYQMSKHLKLLIGYGYFSAGPFVKDTGSDTNANFFYVQPTIAF